MGSVSDFFNNGYKRIVDPGQILTSPDNKQPGVGAYGSGNPTALVQDPSTGLFFDPTTGNTYTDPHGNQPVTNPNVAQQVAANFQARTAFLNQLGGVQGQQNALAAHLNNVINGKAPSVAGMQAAQGMNQITGDQLAQTAGVGGPAAPLAHLMAARNIAQAQTAANNTGAIGRVAEQNAATNQLGGLLNTMAGQNLEGAGTFAQNSAAGEAGQQGLNFQGNQADQERKNKLITGLGGALLA